MDRPQPELQRVAFGDGHRLQLVVPYKRRYEPTQYLTTRGLGKTGICHTSQYHDVQEIMANMFCLKGHAYMFTFSHIYMRNEKCMSNSFTQCCSIPIYVQVLNVETIVYI